MWSTNGPGYMDELCKLTLMVTNIGRLMMHRRLQLVDAQLKAHGVEASLSKEYALYSVKANKEASVSLRQKAPPLVEHIDSKGDF
jgi:hypothetical protein